MSVKFSFCVFWVVVIYRVVFCQDVKCPPMWLLLCWLSVCVMFNKIYIRVDFVYFYKRYLKLVPLGYSFGVLIWFCTLKGIICVIDLLLIIHSLFDGRVDVISANLHFEMIEIKLGLIMCFVILHKF